MRVLIAFDKFKDALSAAEACAVATTTLRAQHSDWQLDPCPLTDGGEGFGETLTTAAHGEIRTPSVAGPRGQPVKAQLGSVSYTHLTLPTID
jgi:glycerate kinase